MRVWSKPSHLLATVVAFAVLGCSANEGAPRPTGTGSAGPASNGVGAGGFAGSGVGGGVGGSGSGGDGGSGGHGGSGGAGGGAGGSGLPCDVKMVVDARCAGTCHGVPPAFGAPMSLVTWQDFQRPAPKNGSIK